MTNDLCEISMLEILCFPIEYAQAVLWPSFVGDLIELVGIKWVGGGASNKARERAGQHLWAGWGQIQLQRPLKLPSRCSIDVAFGNNQIYVTLSSKQFAWNPEKYEEEVHFLKDGHESGRGGIRGKTWQPSGTSQTVLANYCCSQLQTNRYKQIQSNTDKQRCLKLTNKQINQVAPVKLSWPISYLLLLVQPLTKTTYEYN